ncbi:energy transducer TonB [Flavobacterium restrictum]|uniref:TonB C-terminal domain-containing protein n=1 Tax=Flavobacterium restrictum TaxID=2594428 RepID=A0A553E2V1_9FLAO|nr:hypothetical protein [Flavobacterium restrictum]TRX39193.1 hypothetical protein FNW21_09670 [Flavobacterium restrictum]
MYTSKKSQIENTIVDAKPNQFSALHHPAKYGVCALMGILMLLQTPSFAKNKVVPNPQRTIPSLTFLPSSVALDSVKKRKVAIENERVIINLNELDKVAEYPGGIQNFYSKISANLDSSELNYKVFTQIHVSFVIEKDGTMSEIVVDTTIEPDLKKEIIDGLKAIKTKWSPAIMDNQPVRIAYGLPIVLNLD